MSNSEASNSDLVARGRHKRSGGLQTAAREYERALKLNPNDARVHVLYGIYFSIRGNQEQAFLHLHRALQLDPLDLNASDNLAYAYYYSRQYEIAIEQLKSSCN